MHKTLWRANRGLSPLTGGERWVYFVIQTILNIKEHIMIQIGQKIEDQKFEIYHQDQFKKASFVKYQKEGKWLVVFFYPADFTFVCPTELEEIAEMYPQFQKLNTEIVSFSTDTKYVHKAWHDHSKAIAKITYPMGADPTGEITRYFGVYKEDEGVAFRGTFLIDPDGILQTMEIHSNNIGRNAWELLRKLQAAQFVRDNNGLEVCPANWKPGDKTLTPGVKLVGKI